MDMASNCQIQRFFDSSIDINQKSWLICTVKALVVIAADEYFVRVGQVAGISDKLNLPVALDSERYFADVRHKINLHHEKLWHSVYWEFEFLCFSVSNTSPSLRNSISLFGNTSEKSSGVAV